jgi:hypothetical protein
VNACKKCAKEMAREAADIARSPGFADVTAALARSGRFEESFEWRISTYATRGVGRTRVGYRVWCGTEGQWEALVATEENAVEAHYVLARLQQALFYAVGWASWASKTQPEETDPARPWKPEPRNACERYFTELWSDGLPEARSRSEEEAARIEQRKAWAAHGISTLRPHEKPDDRERRMWVETQTSLPGLRFTSYSPTVRRAAEFIAVYEGLARDIPREFGWTIVKETL